MPAERRSKKRLEEDQEYDVLRSRLMASKSGALASGLQQVQTAVSEFSEIVKNTQICRQRRQSCEDQCHD